VVIIDTRWVLTWKNKDGKRIAKARLVAKGHLGFDHRAVETFSGTPSEEAWRVFLVYGLTECWEIAFVDVKTAFLQTPLEGSAEFVLVRMPAYMPSGAPVAPGDIYGLNRAMYGLKDAPRMFQKFLKGKIGEFRQADATPPPAPPTAPPPANGGGGHVIGHGRGLAARRAAAEPLRFHEVDESIYVKTSGGMPSQASPSDELDRAPLADVRGALRNFVDDLCSMSKTAKDDIAALGRLGVKLDDIVVLGSETQKVVGLEYSRRGNVLRIGQLTYVDLSELPAPKRSRVITKMDFKEPEDSEVDMTLEHLLRQLVGKLIWLASKTRWDLRSAAGNVARWANKPCQRLVTTAATLLHMAVEEPRELTFVPAKKPELRLYVDASYNDACCTCICGWVAQLVDESAPQETRDNIVAWHSHREHRLVRSTAAAELLALVAGLQSAPHYLHLARLCYGTVRLSVFTDSQALVDQLRKGRCDAEPRLQGRLEYCLGELTALGGKYYYIDTKRQLADCLTKFLPIAQAWPPRAG
jgi:ribonuclease HI